MVPNGKGLSLDRPPNYYDAHGHIGRHCHAGIKPQPSYDRLAPISTCVMFGAMNEKSAFCRDCANCLKKADLTDIITTVSNALNSIDYT